MCTVYFPIAYIYVYLDFTGSLLFIDCVGKYIHVPTCTIVDHFLPLQTISYHCNELQTISYHCSELQTSSYHCSELQTSSYHCSELQTSSSLLLTIAYHCSLLLTIIYHCNKLGHPKIMVYTVDYRPPPTSSLSELIPFLTRPFCTALQF